MKQAPRAWYELIDKLFLALKFKRCALDANLYVYREHGRTVTIVLYVDDLLIIGNDEDMIQQTWQALNIEFEMIDLGLVHYCLGIEV